MPEKKYRCLECGKMTSDEEGCVCDGCAKILPRWVMIKFTLSLPLSTFPTPFQTLSHFFLVLLNCKTNSTSSYFYNTCFAAHHPPRLYRFIQPTRLYNEKRRESNAYFY